METVKDYRCPLCTGLCHPDLRDIHAAESAWVHARLSGGDTSAALKLFEQALSNLREKSK